MNETDIANWLTDVTPDLPAGVDEEYSAEYRALEEAVAGRPDAEYGSTVIPAVPSDWQRAFALSVTLLGRTRDLRIAVHYTRAALRREGFDGLANGLGLTAGLVETHWDRVHPQLDPDDGDDPGARINALCALVDGAALMADLRDVPFIAPRAHRGLTLRDIELFQGELPLPDGEEMPTSESIGAAFAQAGAVQVHALLVALHASITSVARIETTLTERAGATRALDFAPLQRVLTKIEGFVTEHSAFTGNPASLSSSDADEAPGSDDVHAPSLVDGEVKVRSGNDAQINGMHDVIRALDRICDYYAKHEPSSPLPVLLQRARRLVGKSFIEIIEDVAPDGAGQFRQLGGVSADVY